jgi:hypothetical protein
VLQWDVNDEPDEYKERMAAKEGKASN